MADKQLQMGRDAWGHEHIDNFTDDVISELSTLCHAEGMTKDVLDDVTDWASGRDVELREAWLANRTVGSMADALYAQSPDRLTPMTIVTPDDPDALDLRSVVEIADALHAEFIKITKERDPVFAYRAGIIAVRDALGLGAEDMRLAAARADAITTESEMRADDHDEYAHCPGR